MDRVAKKILTLYFFTVVILTIIFALTARDNLQQWRQYYFPLLACCSLAFITFGGIREIRLAKNRAKQKRNKWISKSGDMTDIMRGFADEVLVIGPDIKIVHAKLDAGEPGGAVLTVHYER